MPLSTSQLTDSIVADEQDIRLLILRVTGGNYHDAEDSYQEAALAAWQRRSTFKRGRKIRPWLTTIAINKGRDRGRQDTRRKDKTVEELFDPPVDHDPIAMFSSKEAADQVSSVLLQCSEINRQFLTLIYLDGWKYQQVADYLDVPLGTVKSRVHAARKEFRSKWLTTQA